MQAKTSPKNGDKLFGKILITNDDGIDAPGLAVLEAIAQTLADEVWVFAPDGNRSGAGRSLTIIRDINVTHHGGTRYSCDGTPTDCMILAMNYFMKDNHPDLVLSGINLGMNVADDITCSGTIGAAWEACVHGVPAIALSQKFNKKRMDLDNPDNFDASRTFGAQVIMELVNHGWPSHVIPNVNFPSVYADDVKGIKAVHVGRHKEADDVEKISTDASQSGQYKIGMWRLKDELHPDSDVGAVFDGYITVCPLSIDMTDNSAKASMTSLSQLSLSTAGHRSAS